MYTPYAAGEHYLARNPKVDPLTNAGRPEFALHQGACWTTRLLDNFCVRSIFYYHVYTRVQNTRVLYFVE